MRRRATGRSGEGTSSSTSSGGTRNRRRRQQEEEPEAPEAEPTDPLVRRVLGCRSYYDVLSIERDANGNVIKKAYRKLALKLHPDKNQTPQAAKAFQKVGAAFATLSDDDKRRDYDEFGERDEQERQADAHAANARRHRHYEEQIDPEELFAHIFGGGGFHMGPGGFVRVQRFGGHRRQAFEHDEEEEGNGFPPRLVQLLQLLPLLLMLILTISAGFSRSGPNFSLRRQGSFLVQRQTSMRGVTQGLPYWVQTDFRATVARDRNSLRKVEQQVEKGLTDQLREECLEQRRRRDSLRRRAQALGSGQHATTLMERSRKVPMSACDDYKRYFKVDVSSADEWGFGQRRRRRQMWL